MIPYTFVVLFAIVVFLAVGIDLARARLRSLESRMAELENISERTNLRDAFLDARDVCLDEAE